jgi:hypothetical protein
MTYAIPTPNPGVRAASLAATMRTCGMDAITVIRAGSATVYDWNPEDGEHGETTFTA